MAVSEASDVVSKSGGLLSSIWKLATNPYVLAVGGLTAGIMLGAGTELSAAQVNQAGADLLAQGGTGNVEVGLEASNVLSTTTSVIGNLLEGLSGALEWVSDGLSELTAD